MMIYYPKIIFMLQFKFMLVLL